MTLLIIYIRYHSKYVQSMQVNKKRVDGGVVTSLDTCVLPQQEQLAASTITAMCIAYITFSKDCLCIRCNCKS